MRDTDAVGARNWFVIVQKRGLPVESAATPMRNALAFYIGLPVIALIFDVLWKHSISEVSGRLLVRQERLKRPSVVDLFWITFQAYLLCGWAAFAVQFIRFHSNQPRVTLHWAYWIWGAFFCVAPFTKAPWEVRDNQPNPLVWIVAGSFLLFAFWHSATGPWSWCVTPVLHLLGA